MNVRAQISVFVIVAIVIVAIVIGFVYLNQSGSGNELEGVLSKLGVSSSASVIQSSISNCLEETSKDALVLVGIQGGFYNQPKKSFDLGWAFIPYYYDQGEFLMPSKKEIEEELGSYVDENLKSCINNLNFMDFEVSSKLSKTSVEINEGEVSFEIDLTMGFSKEEVSVEYKLENQPLVIDSQLYEILEVAQYITDSHKEDPEMICINCVADMAKIRNLYVDMIDFSDEVTVLNVISENVTSADPYVFEFLNRYRGIDDE